MASAEIYTVNELSAKWRLSRRTVIRLIDDEHGVARLGHPATRSKRQHFTRLIPKEVADQVWARLTIRKGKQDKS